MTELHREEGMEASMTVFELTQATKWPRLGAGCDVLGVMYAKEELKGNSHFALSTACR